VPRPRSGASRGTAASADRLFCVRLPVSRAERPTAVSESGAGGTCTARFEHPRQGAPSL
jgi:hypothetical protein